jgi:hypothetical protein
MQRIGSRGIEFGAEAGEAGLVGAISWNTRAKRDAALSSKAR